MKILFNFLLVVLFFLTLFIGIFPYTISTEWGREKFLQAFNYVSNDKLQISRLSLGWVGPQEIEDIQYSSKNLNFSCKKITTGKPLSQILFKHDLGQLAIDSPRVIFLTKIGKEKQLSSLKPMGLSLEGLSFEKKPENEKEEGPSLAYHPLFKLGFFDWIGYIGELDLRKGEMIFLNEKSSPLKFDQLDIRLSRLQKNELFAEASLKSQKKSLSELLIQKGLLLISENPLRISHLNRSF